MKDIRVGDIVHYSPFGGGNRRVKVTNREPDIKNGRPGFDGYLLDDIGARVANGEVWGYDDQITRVEPRAVTQHVSLTKTIGELEVVI
jgi:hypothetical protein